MVRTIGTATAYPAPDIGNGPVGWPANASVAHLNANGTAIVASLASSSSTIAATTRNFRSRRSDGQMYGQRFFSVGSKAPRSAWTRPDAVEGGESGIDDFRNRYGSDADHQAASYHNRSKQGRFLRIRRQLAL